MTSFPFPNIVPPNQQTLFESVPGYEWANRLTLFAKSLLRIIEDIPPGGGATVSITGTTPIVVAPSPITGTGVVSHAVSGVTAGTYGDASNFPAITVNSTGHTTVVTTFPTGIVSASNINVVFGDGRDGNVTLDGSSTPSWTTRSGSVYTMIDACMCSNLTINGSVTLQPEGFPIFVLNTLTNNGTINARSNNGVGSTGGADIFYSSSWTIGQPTSPGTNGAANNSTNATSKTSNIGGGGGKGGNGSVGIGGNGGSISRPTAGVGGEKFAATFLSVSVASFGSPVAYASSTGGAGGGGDGALPGGGGASGAGLFYVIARIIAGSGTMKAVGGNGAAGPTTNTGGGGGGGGGVISVITATSNWQSLNTVTVAGGTGGASGGGAGIAGTNGTAGRIISLLAG